jgi:hypothetical protein
MTDDGSVESAIENANHRMMKISSPMRFIDSETRRGGYPFVDLVNSDNDDQLIATIPATMLGLLTASGDIAAYVESTVSAVGRAYQSGIAVGRDQVQRELRKVIGVIEVAQ